MKIISWPLRIILRIGLWLVGVIEEEVARFENRKKKSNTGEKV